MARSTKISRNFPALGAALLALAVSSPALADVKAGVDAWERGDFAKAVAEWRDPAAKGDADAQFNLGQAYKLGRGVPMDLKQAEAWYKKAADRGHVQAADNYGLVLFQDNRRDEAMPYIRASADRGEPRAQYVLGTAMFNGDIAEKDWVRAYALMTRASAQGLPQASRSLATMDKYIPLAERTKGTQLAAQLERDAVAARQKLAGAAAGLKVADTATGATAPAKPVVTAAAKPAPVLTRPAAGSTIQTTDLPPSRANGTVIPTLPSSPSSAAASAGVDFATMGTPSAATPAPAPAPAPVAPAPRPAAPVAAPVAAAATTAPAVAASGDWRIQLGAFSEEGRARSLWSGLERQNQALAGLQPYLVKAGAITKLQAGPFATQAAAKKACDSVARSGQACFAIRK
ncbi:SPOR domain-containing protein [Blastomonas sp.]|uniref:SPOR domain-containing protein n=1 Tax=Blastomonas sp. TaxID=1909299 RepID=UPI00406A554F